MKHIIMNPAPYKTPAPSPVSPFPPSRSRRNIVIFGGGLAGFGFGVLLLILFTLFLTLVTQGMIVAIFFYGGMLYMIPISLVFLVVTTSVGSGKALREYDAAGSIPALATGGFYGMIVVAVLIVSIVVSLRILNTREQTARSNLLRQRYGYLYYPHSVPDRDYGEQMSTRDSYQQVTLFYQRLPECDTTQILSGGGTFILPCHTSNDLSTRVYLRIRSRVKDNEPYLTIDTTVKPEW